MKIGIFGGSFDPIHKGHINIGKFAIKELNLDKLLYVPTFVSPFKQKSNKISSQDKIAMINLVLEEKMELCDFEIKQNTVSYTINTVKYLKNKYKNDELYLIIGSDNITKLNKWKNIDEIASLTKIVVFKRNKNINKINIKKYNGILLNNPIWNYSSTDFKKGKLNYVNEKVMDYIQSKNLYLSEIIHNSLSAKRAKHSVSTASFAAELAKVHNVSAKKAYTAGLIHDIAKEWDEVYSRNFINKYEPDTMNTPIHFLHQLAGYVWAKYCYRIKDEEILQAVKYHTEMHFNMSNLDKVIFIADKICQGRKFPGIQELRKLCFEDLDLGFKKLVKAIYDWNISNGVIFSQKSEEIYKKYME